MTTAPIRRWQLDAACRGMDPDWFHPGQGEPQGEAMTVCAGCAVRRHCLDHALTRPERLGIWGGTSAVERRRILARRRHGATPAATTGWAKAS